jgi:HEAT repeat protein
MITEIDSVSFCVDPAIPAKQMSRLPLLEGADLTAAIQDLGATAHRPAAHNLIEYLTSADAGARRATATALCSIASPDEAVDILPHLHNPDLVVRREVARALEMTMTETQVEQVTNDLLDSAQDVETRVALVGALQMRAPAEAAKKTMRTLLGDDATPAPLRMRAAHAYALLADKSDVKAMAKLVGRETNLWALQRMAHTLNKLTGAGVSVKPDGDLARSAPGRDRKPFLKQWLKRR